MRRKFLGGLVALGAARAVRTPAAERFASSPPRVNAGSIRGLRAGTRAPLLPILFGSHVDSVRGGGNFDDVGSLEVDALEAIA